MKTKRTIQHENSFDPNDKWYEKPVAHTRTRARRKPRGDPQKSFQLPIRAAIVKSTDMGSPTGGPGKLITE